MYIVDIDDFHENNTGMEFFKIIKKEVPNFKANLFTIIGKCSPQFIKNINKMAWVDVIPHGWLHNTPTEAKYWSYERSLRYLDNIAHLGLTKGFKAPGWQISDGMYNALLKREYWVADQPYNESRRPKKLKSYILDKPNKLHFHIQNVCGNGLEESLDQIINLKGKFGFIKEII